MKKIKLNKKQFESYVKDLTKKILKEQKEDEEDIDPEKTSFDEQTDPTKGDWEENEDAEDKGDWGPNESAPPGREKQVRALKKKFPKGSGAPFAIAWSQHNKESKKSKKTNLNESLSRVEFIKQVNPSVRFSLSIDTSSKKIVGIDNVQKVPMPFKSGEIYSMAAGDNFADTNGYTLVSESKKKEDKKLEEFLKILINKELLKEKKK